jgi:DNA-directed RNA polymerase specialized sigma24 family protein
VIDDQLRALDYIATTEAARIYVRGMDRDDVVQVARIALWRAIETWSPTRRASIETFSRLVVRRALLSELVAAGRQKAQPLNRSLSLDQSAGDDDHRMTIADTIPDPGPSVHDRVVEADRIAALIAWLPEALTPRERQALGLALNGVSYRGDKGADNALQRARRKVARFLVSYDAGLVAA